MEKRIISNQSFVLGKFLPPHTGHVHLIETARALSEKVWVLVCSIQSESIPGDLRYQWVKDLFPDLNVVHVKEEVPQAPEDDPNFWHIWLDIFKRYGPPTPDTVFTSEEYGDEIAQRMGIKHFLVDKERKVFPVSGTKVRTEPIKHWDFIPHNVRPYFTKKIVLTGPESTGKTVLTEKLAKHYQTFWVEEYGREYWNNLNGRRLQYEDISHIAKGHLANEQDALSKANKVLICDTDLIVTQIWSEIYFHRSPEWIQKINENNKYDLHLLMDIDVPWVNDGTREFPSLREFHFNRIKEELEKRKANYKIISGNFEERFEKAVKLIDELLNE